jgi:serine/threonine protein kinase
VKKAAAVGGAKGTAPSTPHSPWAASAFAPTVKPAAVIVVPVAGGKAPAPVPPAALLAPPPPPLGSGLTPGASGSGAACGRCGESDPSARSGRSATSSSSGGGGGGTPSPPPPPGGASAHVGGDVPFSELALARPVGQGAFGRVYLASWRETAVAVKLLAPRPLAEWDAGDVGGETRGVTAVNPLLVGGSISRHATAGAAAADADAAAAAAATALLASVRREAALMARLRHPNVVQYLGTVSHPPAVISEYCPNGSVAEVLARAAMAGAGGGGNDGGGGGGPRPPLLPWSRRLGFALGAAKGMLYLHAQAPPVLHRDLKPANLLVDAGWRVKVADFNLARAADGCGSTDAGVSAAAAAAARSSLAAAANPRWVAPEVLAGGRATPAADVFSFGVVLWELLTCALPWGDLGPWQVVLAVVERRARLPLPASMQGEDGGSPSPSPLLPDADLPPGGLPAAPAAYGALLRACWADDPDARPDFARVIAALRPIMAAQAAADRRPGAGGGGRQPAQPGAAGAA